MKLSHRNEDFYNCSSAYCVTADSLLTVYRLTDLLFGLITTPWST